MDNFRLRTQLTDDRCAEIVQAFVEQVQNGKWRVTREFARSTFTYPGSHPITVGTDIGSGSGLTILHCLKGGYKFQYLVLKMWHQCPAVGMVTLPREGTELRERVEQAIVDALDQYLNILMVMDVQEQ